MKRNLLTAIVSLLIFVMLLGVLSGCKKNYSSYEPQKSAEIIIRKMPSDQVPGEEDDTTSSESSETKESDNDKGINYLVLVNKENKLPDDWEATVVLATAKNDVTGIKIGKDQEYIRDREFEVEEKALEAFYGLQAALKDEGVIILLDSTYRSVDRQKEIWAEFEEEYGKEYTEKYVAVPGYSEHHTGLAIDICIVKDGKIINDNDKMIAQKKIFKKIHSHLAEYGFILRYPDGKEDITGYSYEPWHLRYVGVEAAKEITKRGITLEEYIELKSSK